MITILLIIHIFAGYTGLLAAIGAISVKLFSGPHRWHQYCGRYFFWSMMVIAATAIPIALARQNTFLLLIALFSAYLAFGGWRYAHNHTGQGRKIDFLTIKAMSVISTIMIIYALWMLFSGDMQGIPLLVFGGIGFAYYINERRFLRKGAFENKQRIAQHLTMMLAATIASVTAFAVTNIKIEPQFIVWLAPTILITPLITWWNIKLLR